MKALFVYADLPDEMNTSFYRIIIPAKYLKQSGHDITVTHISGVNYSEIPEVVLFERNVIPEEVDKLRMAGAKRIIATFDDHYALTTKESPSYAYWKGMRAIDGFKEALGMIDLSIVPSRLLVKDYGPASHGKIEFVPNFYDPELWSDDNTIRITPGKTVIGWGGTLQHREGWRQSSLPAALKKINDVYRDKVEIRVYAQTADEFLDNSAVEYTTGGWKLFSEWPGHVRGFDIGLIPLKGEYDYRRSNLKAIEYGLSGIPYVAELAPSGKDPYDGCKGMLRASTSKEWFSVLSELIDNPDHRAELGRDAKAWASQYDMSKNVETYERILWE